MRAAGAVLPAEAVEAGFVHFDFFEGTFSVVLYQHDFSGLRLVAAANQDVIAVVHAGLCHGDAVKADKEVVFGVSAGKEFFREGDVFIRNGIDVNRSLLL